MTTVEANGVTLGVEHFGEAAAPLILLAGGTTMLSWPDALCEALARGGRHVVRYDLRDSGASSIVDPEAPTYTLRDLAADAAALARELDDRPAHLAGIGVGGMVAQVAALDYPDAFSALTLAGTRPVAPGPVDEDLPDHDAATMERLFSRPLPDWSDRAAVAEFATVGAEILGDDPVAACATAERIWDRTATTEPAVQMANQLAMVFSKLDCQPRWRERLSELAIPALVIHGRRDPFFPVGNGEALAHEIPGARLLVLERAAAAIPDAVAGEVAARGWLILPRMGQQPLPAVIQYVGYGGGRAFPFNHLIWASAGYASLVMDTRGQGGTWSPGDTPDLDETGSGPQHPGFLTRGIWDRHSYYYRRLITDAVRALDVMYRHPAVDTERLVVCGASQGGGLALAVAGLSDQVRAALVDVPFLCHFRRAVEITDERPYSELTKFLSVHQTRAEEVFRTLTYFDGMNFAVRAKAPALFSVGLMDSICPPSTVFAAFNYYGGDREIKVWPFNGHEASEHNQRLEQFTFLERLGVEPKA